MAPSHNLAKLLGVWTRLPPEMCDGFMVQLIMDSSEQRYLEKYAALRRATELISRRVPNAFAGLPTLEVYFGKEVNCEACWEPERPGGGKALLFLGDRMMFKANPVIKGQNDVKGYGQEGPRGVADQVYDMQRKSKGNPVRWWMVVRNHYRTTKISAKAVAVVVHEFGHILHAYRSPKTFWENRKRGGSAVPPHLATQVSSYLYDKNLDEFVAEVFTGLMHGRPYPQAVLEEYERLGGPRVF